MNHNVGMQHPGLLAWTGTAAIARDITRFNYFGFVLEVVDTVDVDTVFRIEAAPGSDNDPCIPGTFATVNEVPLCDPNVTADDDALITIPANTPIGTFCAMTIPCRPNKFVRLAAVSGDTANVRGVIVLSGPHF